MSDYFKRMQQIKLGLLPKEAVPKPKKQINDVAGVFINANNIKYYANADTGVVFKFIPVTKKLFYFDDKLLLAQRVPARQYKRGIHQQNTNIRGVLYSEQYEVSFDMLDAYNNNKIINDDVHILNNMFALTATGLFLYNQRIGNVLDDTIHLSTPLFRQEVVDALRANNLPMGVKV